jgi:uncharacterized protein (TIGR02996 family)
MSGRAELEASLREAPDDDTLLIYADALMAAGDPRGELIALELRKPERRALLLRWLASHLKLAPGGDHLHVCDEGWIPFLDSPIGDFCRGAAATARMEHARELVAAIMKRPRPFMTYFQMMAGFDGPLVLDERHVTAMPNIEELDLDGDFDLRAFRHPSVKKFARRSWSCNGLRSWVWPVDLPNCEELVVDTKPWSKAVDQAKVTFAGLPKLRVLDVSECEPQFIAKSQPTYTNLDVFRWLVGLPMIPQLERLRVPSVRTREQAKLLATLIARAPKLHVEVARTYARCAEGLELASDRVRFAPPWPWLPAPAEPAHWQYRLIAPGGMTVDMLSGAIGSGLKRVFDTADEQFREDWRTIWNALDTCTRWSPKKLPWGLIVRAFEGFPHEDIGSATWLREEIMKLAGRIRPDALVSLAPKPK